MLMQEADLPEEQMRRRKKIENRKEMAPSVFKSKTTMSQVPDTCNLERDNAFALGVTNQVPNLYFSIAGTNKYQFCTLFKWTNWQITTPLIYLKSLAATNGVVGIKQNVQCRSQTN